MHANNEIANAGRETLERVSEPCSGLWQRDRPHATGLDSRPLRSGPSTLLARETSMSSHVILHIQPSQSEYVHVLPRLSQTALVRKGFATNSVQMPLTAAEQSLAWKTNRQSNQTPTTCYSIDTKFAYFRCCFCCVHKHCEQIGHIMSGMHCSAKRQDAC